MAVDWTWASPLPHAVSATARLDKYLRHARKTIITCDRGRRRLAFSCYKWGGGGAPVAHLSFSCSLLCSIACDAIDGATQEVLCRRERKGPSRGPQLPGAQARPRPSAQARRDPRRGPPSRWRRGTRQGLSHPWWSSRRGEAPCSGFPDLFFKLRPPRSPATVCPPRRLPELRCSALVLLIVSRDQKGP